MNLFRADRRQCSVSVLLGLLLAGVAFSSFLYVLEDTFISSSKANDLSETGFAIITDPSFENTGITWSPERLRDWHNQNDTLSTYIVDMNDILSDPSYFVDGPWGDGNTSNPYWRSDEDAISNLSMFNDTQAILRNYIRYAHHELNVRYVLLVGDEDKIPTRKLSADGYGAPACGGTTIYYENIPTHIYYACLNGTFNDDEDSNNHLHEVAGWGENATHNADHNIDEVDWDHEVAVGRITPHNNKELGNVIQKTIAYMELSGDEDYLSRVTLAGHHLGFGGDVEWGINYSKQLGNATCNDWNHLTNGFNSSIFTSTYMDPNPNRPEEHIDYTDENVRSIFDEGVHVWYQSGHGNPTQWSNNGVYGDSWDIFDVTLLENEFCPLIYAALPCLSGRWDDTNCLSEQFVNDDHGAFASIMNSRYGWGSYDNLHSTSHYIGREFFDAYFGEGHVRLGDMLFDAFRDSSWLRDANDGTIRWACFDQNIIGNPAVKMRFPSSSQEEGDVITISFTIPKTITHQGYLLPINVTFQNQGNVTVTLNVTIYANTTEIGHVESIILDVANIMTLTFTWNTTSFNLGNYTIGTVVEITSGESDPEQSSIFCEKPICITILGDIDADRDVDIYDVVKIIGVYRSQTGDPNYKPNLDINGDGIINIYDVVICTSHYGQSW